MNSRERVQAALKHQPIDRIPIFMWFHPETARILGKLLEIPADWVGNAFGNDVQQTWVNNNLAMEGIIHQYDGETHIDDWGIKWVRSFGFNQIEHHPLKDKSPTEVMNYSFPKNQLTFLFTAMDQADYAREGGYFLSLPISV